MATQKERLEDLEGRIKTVESGQQLPPQSNWGNYAQWGAVIVAVLALGASVWNLYGNHAAEDFILRVDKRIDSKLEPSSSRLSVLEQKMSTVQAQLTLLLAGKHLVEAENSIKRGNLKKAIKSTKDAYLELITAAATKTLAPPEYFEESIRTLDEADRRLNDKILDKFSLAEKWEFLEPAEKVRNALAEYRSSLGIPPPPTVPTFVPGTIGHAIVADKGSHWSNMNWDFSRVSGNAIYLEPELRHLYSDVRIRKSTIKGGHQVLDGIHWEDVTFVNTRIVYQGGDLELTNVKFVNCTFDAPLTNRGRQLINYAALGRKQLTFS